APPRGAGLQPPPCAPAPGGCLAAGAPAGRAHRGGRRAERPDHPGIHRRARRGGAAPQGRRQAPAAAQPHRLVQGADRGGGAAGRGQRGRPVAALRRAPQPDHAMARPVAGPRRRAVRRPSRAAAAAAALNDGSAAGSGCQPRRQAVNWATGNRPLAIRMSDLLLTPAEARVLAALVEKSILTPQYYPMTVNALMLAANQKTVRNPVMNLSEGDTGAALNRLESLRLAQRDGSGSRAVKWRHQMQHQLLLKPAELALLVTLMLRGPQTGSELRANAQILGGPAETEGLQAALASLHDRAQPLVTELPRAAGQKEARLAHLLCGAP